jgi:predicted GIY-YIG superfamily endonuclease
MARPKTGKGKTLYVGGEMLPAVEAILSGKSVGGIYAIKNSKCGRVYVGSTKDFHSRWRSHKSDLSSGNHPNKKLQSAWNEYGPKSFSFIVLEVVDNIASLVDRENEWMASFGSFSPEKGYNSGAAKTRTEGVPEGVQSVSHSIRLSDFNSEVFERMDSKERGGIVAAGLELKTMGYMPFFLAINGLGGFASIEKKGNEYHVDVRVKGAIHSSYIGHSQPEVLLNAIRGLSSDSIMETFTSKGAL